MFYHINTVGGPVICDKNSRSITTPNFETAFHQTGPTDKK